MANPMKNKQTIFGLIVFAITSYFSLFNIPINKDIVVWAGGEKLTFKVDGNVIKTPFGISFYSEGLKINVYQSNP